MYGGRQPIIGAHVYVLAAATAAYGGVGVAASTTNSSSSLLTAYSTGSYPTTLDNSGGATNGMYYVTTDANGQFGLTSEYTCAVGQNVYLYSLGGDAGAGSSNAAATLMAVLGTCTSSGTFSILVPQVSINEISTVAAAFALAGFTTDPLHVGSDETASANTTQSTAKTGLANAFASAQLLYDDTQYVNVARLTTAGGNGTSPQARVDALANSLAACVNSTGSTSTECTTLFGAATIDGASGASATDTADAAINVAHFPAHNVNTIFAPITGIGTPYIPTLSTAPNDWTMGVSYTGGGLSGTYGVAIDSAGNVWTANHSGSSTSKFNQLGVAQSGSSGYTGSGLSSPYGVAVDTNNNAWLSNNSAAYISRFSSAGVANSPYAPANLGADGRGIAVDSVNNIYVTTANAIIMMTNSSSYASANFYHPGGISTAWGVAVAAGNPGNIWVASEQEATEQVNPTNGNGLGSSDNYTCGKNVPIAVAVDSRGYPWTISDQYTNVYVFNTSPQPIYSTSGCTGSYVTNSVGYSGGGLSSPKWIATDGNGTAWVANSGNSSVTAITNAGTAISGTGGYTGGSMSTPYGLAVDMSGNVWVGNAGANRLVELIGAATPVVAPLSVAAGASKLGTRP